MAADRWGMETSTDDHLSALADTVWAERNLVEHLLYKLTAAKLVLAADLRRYVPRSLEEVETVVERLDQAETRRAAVLDQLCAAWGEPAGSLTLADLAERAPEPWATMFSDHHERFTALAAEIAATAEENRRLASTSLHAVQESLASITGSEGGTYTAAGVTGVAAYAGPTRFDRAL